MKIDYRCDSESRVNKAYRIYTKTICNFWWFRGLDTECYNIYVSTNRFVRKKALIYNTVV